MVAARQDHHQGLLDEKTERQVWQPSFPSKKSCIDGSLHKGTRELRRVLTRYHYVDVGQFVPQDLQGFGHPGQFVSGQKSHREAGLGGMNGPPRSFGRRVNLQEDSARVIEKGTTRWCQLDATSCTRHELGANFFLKVPELAAERRLRGVQFRLCRKGQTLGFGDRNEITQVS